MAANPRELKNLNDSLTKTLEITKQLEGSFVGLQNKMVAGLKAIDDQAHKNLSTDKKRKTSKKETKEAITGEQKQAQSLLRAQQDLTLAYKNNAIEILKVRKVKQDMVKIQKLELTQGKGAIKTYEQLSSRYRLTANRAKDLAARYGQNSKEARKAIASAKEYNNQLKSIDKSIGNSQRNVGNYTKGLKNLALGYVGLRSVIGVFKNIAQIVSKFSSAQSNLAAVMGKTKKEITALTKSAKMYGSTTAFTATQVTELQTELAKLGFEESEILSATESVLALAQATGVELSSAAKVTGSALKAFGLDATEADRVTSVLAVATTKSALSFQDYETALSTVAPVARSFGFGIEDTVALLGKLRDAGFDASTAATSTKNILLNLADSNGKLAKSLGGSVNNFDELIPSLVKLRKQGVSLNETLQLTDKRSVAAFNQFLDGAESAKELRDGLIDVKSELDDMVATQLDNLTGDLKQLTSAWEGFILGLEDGTGALASAGRGIVQFATNAIQSLNVLDLWFKREGKFELDDFMRILDAADFVELESGKNVREILNNFKELEEGLKGQDYINNIDNLKAQFTGLFEAEGETAKSALGLWDAYLIRREDQLQAEIQALADFQVKEAERQAAAEAKALRDLEKLEADREKAAAKALKEKEKHNKAMYGLDLKRFKLEQELSLLRFKNAGATEIEIARFALEQKNMLYAQEIKLAEKYAGVIGDTEKKILREKQIEARKDIIKLYEFPILVPIELQVAQEGDSIQAPTVGTSDFVADQSIWEELGFTDEEGEKAISATSQTYSAIMDLTASFADQQVETANRIVEAENVRVDAAERNLDRQITLAEQGYANNVTEAQRNLDLQKRTQEKALEDQRRAVEQKQRLETVQQTVGLLTASVNVLQTFSTIPIVGWALGIAAVGAMIAAFVSQKAKAKQATATFGDGGVVDLVGGSHASGNDISFGNVNGTELRAEGGEKGAIFNRMATRRYSEDINNYVKAANSGRLEERYTHAFSLGATPVIVESAANFDTKDLKAIKGILSRMEKQGSDGSFNDSRGRTIEKKGNLTRIINRG